MAPTGASATREYRKQGTAVRAGHCGDGIATGGPTRAAAQADGLASRSCGSIEVEIDGMTIRIGRGVDAKTVAAVLRALKGGA